MVSSDVISRVGRLYEQCGVCIWVDGWIKEKLMRSRGCAKTSNNGHVNYNVAQGNELVIFSLGKYFRSIFFSFFFFRGFSFIRRFRIDYAHVKREKSLSFSLFLKISSSI